MPPAGIPSVEQSFAIGGVLWFVTRRSVSVSGWSGTFRCTRHPISAGTLFAATSAGVFACAFVGCAPGSRSGAGWLPPLFSLLEVCCGLVLLFAHSWFLRRPLPVLSRHAPGAGSDVVGRRPVPRARGGGVDLFRPVSVVLRSGLSLPPALGNWRGGPAGWLQPGASSSLLVCCGPLEICCGYSFYFGSRPSLGCAVRPRSRHRAPHPQVARGACPVPLGSDLLFLLAAHPARRPAGSLRVRALLPVLCKQAGPVSASPAVVDRSNSGRPSSYGEKENPRRTMSRLAATWEACVKD